MKIKLLRSVVIFIVGMFSFEPLAWAMSTVIPIVVAGTFKLCIFCCDVIVPAFIDNGTLYIHKQELKAYKKSLKRLDQISLDELEKKCSDRSFVLSGATIALLRMYNLINEDGTVPPIIEACVRTLVVSGESNEPVTRGSGSNVLRVRDVAEAIKSGDVTAT